ncbi:MAG: hypothetical protein F6K65_30285 [Moorea sp. SIO3C2]|nr:hypothetical protein [Moorena sp. SIO3C2]
MRHVILNYQSVQRLYSPENLAISEGKQGSKMATMREVLEGRDRANGQYPVAKGGEGKATDYVGIKPESHGESGYSLVIGGGQSPAKFMESVESMGVIGVKKKKDEGAVIIPLDQSYQNPDLEEEPKKELEGATAY